MQCDELNVAMIPKFFDHWCVEDSRDTTKVPQDWWLLLTQMTGQQL